VFASGQNGQNGQTGQSDNDKRDNNVSDSPDAGLPKALTYGRYLCIDDLLALQQPRSDGPEHDELLFIVIHQVYELWFKELLHEIDFARQLLEQDESHRAQHILTRILTILKVAVGQIDILETMTPLEFLSFRARLEAASGFQSDQFRQIEFVLGRKSEAAINRFADGSRARVALQQRYHEPTLWDAFLRYLSREGYTVPHALLARDVTTPIEPSLELQRVLIDLYRRDTKNAELCERFVDLDEGMQEWRYRHVKMVERTIGGKTGTGGSGGASYLRGTLGQPLFPDLWEIRSHL
jgi:tryptophan 2,3-dioxygenase